MKRLIAVVFLMVCMTCGAALAADGDAAQAVDLVKKAAAYYKTNGMEKALDEINNPKGEFNRGELYVFVYDQKATMLAHPNNKLIGQNLLDVPDADGKMFRKEIVATVTAKGSGWIDYKYKNPKTKEAESKTTYCEKSDELILCCGIYKK
jgi:cytochrome c